MDPFKPITWRCNGRLDFEEAGSSHSARLMLVEGRLRLLEFKKLPVPTYFTVDRLRRLHPGQKLDPQRDEDSKLPTDLREHVDELFPQGLSDHGRSYFVLGRFSEADRARELTWEYARRAFFPHRPSRLSCTYAWQTLDEARRFSNLYVGAPVWEVASDDAFVANMHLLIANFSAVRISQVAHAYWQGVASPSGFPLGRLPKWEVLLPPSATVIKQAD